MEKNVQEAYRAKAYAEKHFAERDYTGAKNYALKAQTLYPDLDGISQMVATFGVYIASEVRINGEFDLYAILGLDPCVDKVKLKKQYKKLAVLLHPDKNKSVGSEGAFKLITEAWSILSDHVKRNVYDQRRNLNDSFWTVCTSCHVQYEYLRKYVNKKLSCKNCRDVFIAVETGVAPISGSYPYIHPTTTTTTPIYCTSNNVSGHGHVSDYVSNVTIQWDMFNNEKANRVKVNGKHVNKSFVEMASSKPVKKRKVDVGPTLSESQNITDTSNIIITPVFDVRQMLINKGRIEIRKKLEEMKLVKRKKDEKPKKSNPIELKRSVSMSITVPDSDFHDFDKDRSEECFKAKQIWGLYDEEDGMPRLYCIIREVISIKPFKIHISYLNSKTDTEFGTVNWLESGFTKSCGNFRVFHSEIVDQVNIFSHVLAKEKSGRGGCVRIYPRKGDIWAVYRNWSVNWNKTTVNEVRHEYEMVEIVDDYCEEVGGIYVIPLLKVDGYKTVYRRSVEKDEVRWIPKREMLRFSHQVPSCLLKGEGFNLVNDCWDLDPAATPDQLLKCPTQLTNLPDYPSPKLHNHFTTLAQKSEPDTLLPTQESKPGNYSAIPAQAQESKPATQAQESIPDQLLATQAQTPGNYSAIPAQAQESEPDSLLATRAQAQESKPATQAQESKPDQLLATQAQTPGNYSAIPAQAQESEPDTLLATRAQAQESKPGNYSSIRAQTQESEPDFPLATWAQVQESKPATQAQAQESKPATQAQAQESKPATQAQTQESKPDQLSATQAQILKPDNNLATRAQAQESKPATQAQVQESKPDQFSATQAQILIPDNNSATRAQAQEIKPDNNSETQAQAQEIKPENHSETWSRAQESEMNNYREEEKYTKSSNELPMSDITKEVFEMWDKKW